MTEEIAPFYVAEGVVFGENVQIAPGVVLGSEGFGYELADDGEWEWREHPFGVVVGDNVTIGANTVVDRGRWRDTQIGAGTKIDAHVFIAHNVTIGKRCLLVAHAKFGGSSMISDDVIVGLGATICPHVGVGHRAIIGAGAVVTKTVPAGEVWAGVPAKYMRLRLPDETL